MAGLIVSWTDRSELEDGFRIQWGTDGVTFLNSATVAANVETYTISGLPSNTLCTVQVTATRAGFPDSDILGPVDAYTPPPIVPPELTATAGSSGVINLSWALPVIEPVTGYRIYIRKDDEWEVAGTVASGVSAYSATSLLDSTTYQFYVVGYNANDGHADAETDPSNVAIETTAAESVAPTVTSATIDAAGTLLALVFSEPVKIGSGGSGGLALSATGGAVTAAYSGGSGTGTLTWSLSRTITSAETVTRSYAQPGNGIEDLVGNDLASFSGQAVSNGSTHIAYLLEENFEETGASGWTTSGASPNFDYTLFPAPLEGAQSLATSSASHWAWKNFAGTDEVWAYCMFNIAGAAGILRIQDSIGNAIAHVQVQADGILRAYIGSSFLTSGVPSVAFGTTYHLWMQVIRGTGSNAVLRAYLSTNGVRPAGLAAPQLTNGAPTGQPARVRLEPGGTALTIIDKIRVASVPIGSNPA